MSKFKPKKSKLSILRDFYSNISLTEIPNLNIEDADFYSNINFLEFQTYIHFLGQIWVKKVELSERWHTEHLEDMIARIPRKV